MPEPGIPLPRQSAPDDRKGEVVRVLSWLNRHGYHIMTGDHPDDAERVYHGGTNEAILVSRYMMEPPR